MTEVNAAPAPVFPPNWVANTAVLWRHRRTLVRVAAVALALSLALAFLLPKRYDSTAKIMPPSGSAPLLAALAGRSSSLGGLGALAGSLIGANGNTALFVDMLQSGTVSGHLIDRFDLQHVYHARFKVDAAKRLARQTKIVDDKKSGVITVTVSDTDPVRARDLAQAYLDELNLLVNRTNTSSAHQERVFLDRRLLAVRADLEKAQQQLSDFSSTHATVDLKEQARATVDAASRLQAQLIVEQSTLDSLRQMYGDSNVRVRSAEARIAGLRGEIAKMGGSSKALPPDELPGKAEETANYKLYPGLRQLPRLAVPYANLYREVQTQEAVYQLLTQQYELARLEEAKDVPVVSIIDAPGIPEKKSFPPRLLLSLLLTAFAVGVSCAWLLLQSRWQDIPAADPGKALLGEIGLGLRAVIVGTVVWSGSAIRGRLRRTP
jgi:capsule polysaccharide export protein KpsE/RkpR